MASIFDGVLTSILTLPEHPVFLRRDNNDDGKNRPDGWHATGWCNAKTRYYPKPIKINAGSSSSSKPPGLNISTGLTRA